MTQTHPITPPTELVKQWEDQHYEEGENYDVMLIQAYQAGADQELEACCKWLCEDSIPNTSIRLRSARRPKPPSLKEQAMETLNFMESEANYDKPMFDTIRRALGALDD